MVELEASKSSSMRTQVQPTSNGRAVSGDRVFSPRGSNTEQKNYLRSARYGAAQIVRIFSGSRQTALQASTAASCKAW